MQKIITLALLVLAAPVLCYGQYDMGDAELNTCLTTIINKNKVNFSAFRSYVIANYKVTNNRYDYMESGASMSVGDIYLAVEIEKVSKRSLTEVIDSYKKNKKNGWGAIAKDFGVVPGSSAFETLKDDAYKFANGTPRPKPKPVVKAKPTAKPATKTTAKTKSTKPKPKTTSTAKPTTKAKPKTTQKPAAKKQ